MQILAINLVPDYGVLVITGASLAGVGFMIWFLIALLLDANRPQRRLSTVYVMRIRKQYLADHRGAAAKLTQFRVGD